MRKAPPAPDSVRNQLIGNWQIFGFEQRNVSGDIFYPLGSGLKGLLSYSFDGLFSLAVMGSRRQAFASDDVFSSAIEERSLAFSTYISYSGRFRVLGNVLSHSIDVSLFPNWVGQHHEHLIDMSTPDVLILHMNELADKRSPFPAKTLWSKVRFSAG